MLSMHPAVRRFDVRSEKLEEEIAKRLSGVSFDETAQGGEISLLDSIGGFVADTLIKGRIIEIDANNKQVLVDIGAKAEGILDIAEFEEEELVVGNEVEVLTEMPDEDDPLPISKRKADRKRKWNEILEKYNEGDTVTGVVSRKIKGGLLVDIGVPVFLPASQVSIRRTKDISEYMGQELECEIIKIDESRENIVVSRRKMQEEQREKLKQMLLSEIQQGEIREGVVKNIADFGAFVDLGGIDGLLHITDMSWGRVQHPSEVVTINQTIQVKVLKVDSERERIALGLKQLSSSPWEGITERYPVDSRHKGHIVNIMSYGAFVKLEEGIEGLVHISEMSWTRRVNDPREIVDLNQEVEVVVLGVNEEKQEISLGMKQLEENPWDKVHETYTPGRRVSGTVRNLTNYGAFVEIEPGIDGLLHVTDVSWTRKISHPNEVLNKGDNVECVVLNVDTEKHRIALGMKQLSEDPWDRIIPEKYGVGAAVEGSVTKVTNFGIFVALEDDLEGLLHVSELPERTGEGVPKPGDHVKVRVIKFDSEERKIGLTLQEAEA